jgi:hypothetical protein
VPRVGLGAALPTQARKPAALDCLTKPAAGWTLEKRRSSDARGSVIERRVKSRWRNDRDSLPADRAVRGSGTPARRSDCCCRSMPCRSAKRHLGCHNNSCSAVAIGFGLGIVAARRLAAAKATRRTALGDRRSRHRWSRCRCRDPHSRREGEGNTAAPGPDDWAPAARRVCRCTAVCSSTTSCRSSCCRVSSGGRGTQGRCRGSSTCRP